MMLFEALLKEAFPILFSSYATGALLKLWRYVFNGLIQTNQALFPGI